MTRRVPRFGANRFGRESAGLMRTRGSRVSDHRCAWRHVAHGACQNLRRKVVANVSRLGKCTVKKQLPYLLVQEGIRQDEVLSVFLSLGAQPTQFSSNRSAPAQEHTTHSKFPPCTHSPQVNKTAQARINWYILQLHDQTCDIEYPHQFSMPADTQRFGYVTRLLLHKARTPAH